jgi:GntR family transcriptional repressor for pyruvate dehydrogenase complex
MWDSIAAQFEEYSMKVIGMPGRLQRAHADHENIADAIIGGDAERASALAGEHVKTVQRELNQRQAELRRPPSAS